MAQIKLRRRFYLITAVVVMTFAGTIYAWSITKAPFEIVYDGVVVNAAQLGLNYSLSIVFFCIGGLASGLISKFTTATLRFIIGALMLSASYIFSSLQIATLPHTENYFLLFLSYSLLGGLGIGIVYNTVISTVNSWYPDKRGFSSGLMFMGFGVSMLVIGRIADLLGNSEAVGWRSTYVIIAIALGIVFLAAAIIIKPPPPDTVLPEARQTKKSNVGEVIKDYSALEMIKRPSFILVFIYTTILASSGNAAISFAKDIVLDVGSTEGFAITAVGMLGVSNGVGRLVSGWLFDKFGIRQTQFVSSAILVLAPLTVVAAIALNSLLLGVIGLCLCGFSLGFAPTTCSVFATGFYGLKNFPLNFGILSLILIPASFAATLVGNIKVSTGEFITAFIVLTALAVAGFFVNLAIRKP